MGRITNRLVAWTHGDPSRDPGDAPDCYGCRMGAGVLMTGTGILMLGNNILTARKKYLPLARYFYYTYGAVLGGVLIAGGGMLITNRGFMNPQNDRFMRPLNMGKTSDPKTSDPKASDPKTSDSKASDPKTSDSKKPS